MRRATIAAVACYASFCGLSRAAELHDAAVGRQTEAGQDEAAGNRATSANDDSQDLLFLGPMRPVLIRLHVKVNRQPFRQLWRRNIEKLFDEADANRDGAIDLAEPKPAAEGRPAPKAAEIEVLAKNAAVYLGQEAEVAKNALRQLAAEHDGRFSEQALVEYFSRVAPPLAIAASNGPLRYAGAGMAPAPALFPLLDVDGDQQLTAEELSAAEARLANRDFNEDEVLSPRELTVAPDASLAAATPAANEAKSILPGAAPLYLIGPDMTPEWIVAAIIERYDHDRDGSLAAAASGREIAFPEAQTAQFDRDGDGRLTADELLAFARGGPGVELTAMIGKGLYVSPSQRKKLVQIHASAGKGVEAKLSRNGAFKLTLSDASLDLYLSQSDPAQTADNGPTLQNFDADNNGYLDAAELAGNAELAAAFAAIDADGDGKIFGAEFNAYAQRQARAASSRLLLEVADGGQQLLNVLDSAADNVLSVRELRGAAAALDKADSNGDGRLAGSEIPQRLAIELSRNTPAGAQAAGVRPIADDPERREAAAGPAWFRKLDRNRDGDLSRREFVGPVEVFERLDADGDGLVSAAEAEQAQP
ncbi:MAG TPA: hypothetical protein VMV10_22175 [Pirellulales bacterium]|nr:hypothetical protein [Pirellulales bacterium]